MGRVPTLACAIRSVPCGSLSRPHRIARSAGGPGESNAWRAARRCGPCPGVDSPAGRARTAFATAEL